MDFLTILGKIFEVCIVPLLSIFTVYLIKLIRVKMSELGEKIGEKISDQTDAELAKTYVQMLSDIITECVIATNQTYVSALKEAGKFDIDAQKEALSKTYNAVLDILSKDAYTYLEKMYGDIHGYILQKIEAEVNKNK